MLMRLLHLHLVVATSGLPCSRPLPERAGQTRRPETCRCFDVPKSDPAARKSYKSVAAGRVRVAVLGLACKSLSFRLKSKKLSRLLGRPRRPPRLPRISPENSDGAA